MHHRAAPHSWDYFQCRRSFCIRFHSASDAACSSAVIAASPFPIGAYLIYLCRQRRFTLISGWLFGRVPSRQDRSGCLYSYQAPDDGKDPHTLIFQTSRRPGLPESGSRIKV